MKKVIKKKKEEVVHLDDTSGVTEAVTTDVVGEDEMPFWCDHLDPVSNALFRLHPQLSMI